MPLLPEEDNAPLRGTQIGGATSLMPEHDEVILRLRTAMGAAAPKNPDKSAEVFHLQSRTGLPQDVIERNLDNIKAEVARQGFDAEEFKAKSPAMAQWLSSNPDYVSIAKDDFDNLSNLEALTRALSRGVELGRKQTMAGRLAYSEASGNTEVSERVRQLEKEIEREPTGQGFMRQYVYRSAKILGQLFESSSRATSVGLATGGAGAVVGGAASLFAGPAAPLAAPITASTGFVVGATSGTIAGFIEDTYRTEAGLAYLSLRKIKGPEGQTIDPLVQRGAAVFIGLANASLEYLGARAVAAPFISAGKMLMADTARTALARPTTATALMEFGKSWGLAVGGEVATELMQEGVNIFAEEIAKTITDPRFKTLMRDPSERDAAIERLAQIVEETFKGMVLLGVPGAGVRASVEFRKANEAKSREEIYKELGKGVGKSKTFERLPEKVQEAIRAMTIDGPIENLYLPEETFTMYWQGQNIDPRDVAKEIFGSTQPYDEARASGTDIQIPTELYASKLAPSEHNEFFARELRRRPDEMNAREGVEYLERVKQEQAKEKEEAKPVEDGRAKINQNVAEQLEKAGFEKSAAGTMAEQMAAVFSTQAQRMGDIDPVAMFAEYGLEIKQAEMPEEQGQTIFAQARRVTQDPEFIQRFGQSVTIDVDGQPRMFYHGSSRDIYEWRPKQAGAIYVTPDAELATDFTKYSMDYAQRHGIQNAAPVIYPLFVKADRPFDFDAPEHVQGLMGWLEQSGKGVKIAGLHAAKQLAGYYTDVDTLIEGLKNGAWGAVEHPLTQEYIRANGYDGFWVMEAGAKNLAVFSPDQLFNALTGENLRNENSQVLFQNLRPVFYSELTKKIESHKQEVGTPMQWAGIIGNLPGVKEQEIAWSGVIEWLELQGKRVTKKQIVDYLNANGVQVEEVIKGGQAGKPITEADLPQGFMLMDAGHGRWRVIFNPGAYFKDEAESQEGISDEDLGFKPTDVPDVTATGSTPTDAVKRLVDMLTDHFNDASETLPGYDQWKDVYQEAGEELANVYGLNEEGELERPGSTQYGGYQIDTAAKNYTELLLKLPSKSSDRYIVRENDRSGEFAVVDLENGQEVESYIERASAENHAGKLNFDDGVNRGYSHKPTDIHGQYESPHWGGVANILAHVRFNERTDQSGKRVLFIEEIQSDWAQDGREQGFKGDEEGDPGGAHQAYRELMNEATIILMREYNAPRTDIGNWDDGAVRQALRQKGHGELADKLNAAAELLNAVTSQVPSGPFVRNTDAWVGLALKRMIRWAAENGFERVAWTTGDQQNERYKLSAQVRRLEVLQDAPTDKAKPDGSQVDGELYIKGWSINNKTENADLSKYVGSWEELGRYIGPELAAKAKEQMANEWKGLIVKHHEHFDWVEPFTLDLSVNAGDPAWEVMNFDETYSYGVFKSMDLAADAQKQLNRERRNAGRIVQFEGLDLEVGEGAGMREFYDKIVTKVANDLLKKFGGGKVESFQMRRYDVMQNEDFETYSAYLVDEEGDLDPVAPKFKTADEAREHKAKNERQLGFLITPELKEKALTGLPLFQDKKRGFIRFGSNRKFQIGVLEKADLSTVIHESGHFYLEIMRDMVKKLNARDPATLTDQHKKILEDAATIAKWMGIESLDKIEVKHHEMFARANEAYVMEGRAPSGALRAAFARFRAWLVALYRTVSNLGVRMNDDVREVFDRLYATDAEIEAVRTEGAIEPIFLTPERAKMTPEQFEAYKKTVEDASREAQEALQQRLLDEYRREQKAWWKDARAEVHEEVSREFNNKREYIAMAVLRSGELPGGQPLPEGMQSVKLDRQALYDVYGTYEESDVVKKLHRLNIYREKGGVHPDVAAEALGFKSGDEMVQALINLEDRRVAINRETDARMLAKYGSILLDGTLVDKARQAVMNDKQSKVLHAELRALWAQSRAAEPVVSVAAREARRARSEGLGVVRSSIAPLDLIRQVAQEQIARTRVRDLSPHKFYVAARRYAVKAADEAAKDNYEEAAQAKQRQLLNLELYREAVKAKDESDATIDYMRKFRSPRVRERLGKAGGGYLEQIESLLDRFDFARITVRESDRRMSLAKWIEEQEKQGFTVDLPENILNEAFRKPWREMTYEEMIGVRDAARHIMHLAKLKNKLLVVQDKRDFDVIKEQIVQNIEKNARHEKRSHKETRLPQDEALRGISGFFASHRKLASLARELDGFKDGGPLWNYLMRTLNRAGTAEARMHAEASKALKKIFGVYNTKDLVAMYRKSHIPEVNDSLSKMAQLMVALNWGNEDNRQKLMDGYGWGPTQVQAVLSRLDERDWKFVQNVWDFINDYWPQIEAKQKRVTGIGPQKVEATAVQTPFGEFKGGYFPLKYDDRQSPKAFGNRVKEAAKLTELGGYVRSTTRRGHTIERIEGVKMQPRLDFGVILEHVHQVIHDLTHHEALIDTNRLVGSRDFSRAVIDHFGDQVYDQFRSALTDIAAGNVPAQGQLEKGLNWIRHGATIAAMGWNLMTGFMQFLGASQSIHQIGAVHFAKGVGRWIGDATQMENSVKWVHAKSDFMRTRHDTMMREVNEIRNAIRVRGKLAPIEDSYFWLITRMQMVVDIPTWLGAYEKFMEETNGDEAKAIDLADSSVLESQGGGQVKDLARVQRGGPLLKLWTNFYSYFNVTFNKSAEAYRRTSFKNPSEVGRFAVDMLLLYVFPSVLATLIKESLKGDTDDLDKLLRKMAREQISYLLGTVLLARELSGTIQGFYGYEGPAGARLFSELGQFIRQLEQGEVDAALLKSLNAAAGILFHYPAGQVQRTVEGFVAMSEGRTNNPLALLVGPRKEDK